VPQVTDRPWSGDPSGASTGGGTLEGSAPPAYPSEPPAALIQDPGWYVDPGGRHQFRYWDGAGWTDQVADGGAMTVEPLVGYGPTPSVAPGPAAPPAKKRRGLLVGLAIAAVVLIVAVVAVVLVLSGGDGSGSFSGELENEGDTFAHAVSPGEDTVVLIEVTSDDGEFDPIIGVSTDQATLDQYADFFESDEALDDAEFAGALRDADQRLFAVADITGPGEAERTFVATPFGGEFDVLVTGAGGSVGSFEMEITIEEFAGPDDPDAYLEELAQQDFVEDFAPPRSPIEDVLDDLIEEGD
jgi:hypothetical protein